MKLVIDCNVLISAGLTNGVCRKAIIKAVEHEVVISPAIIDEYKEVISRKKFVKYYSFLESMVDAVVAEATLIADNNNCNITLPDPDDLIYLNAALNVRAKYLITGNNKDFPEKYYGSLEVITAREFLFL